MHGIHAGKPRPALPSKPRPFFPSSCCSSSLLQGPNGLKLLATPRTVLGPGPKLAARPISQLASLSSPAWRGFFLTRDRPACQLPPTWPAHVTGSACMTTDGPFPSPTKKRQHKGNLYMPQLFTPSCRLHHARPTTMHSDKFPCRFN